MFVFIRRVMDAAGPGSLGPEVVFRPLKTYQIVVDLVVAALFLAVAGVVEIMAGRNSGSESLLGTLTMLFAGVLIALIFSAALAIRRWSPLLALALAWAGAVLQISLGRPPTVADLAIFGVLYATAAYGTRRVYWAGFCSALVGAVVITAYVFLGPLFGGGSLPQRLLLAVAVLVAAVFALLLAWTVGAFVRASLHASANRAAQKHAEAATAAEQERVRIARDMHDVVAHSLAVVIAQADGARYAASADPTAATISLSTISTTARAALSDVRLLLTQLRFSEPAGPQPTLANLEELYAHVRAAGVELHVDVDPAPSINPPTGVQLAVYRILQESLTNALRHGDGGPVAVTLAWYPNHVAIGVRNTLKAGVRVAESGHGLIGMGERANIVGGWLTTADIDGQFVVAAELPTGPGVGR
jgi:signal transduction histidine kinase